jgi:hypothetical protein
MFERLQNQKAQLLNRLQMLNARYYDGISHLYEDIQACKEAIRDVDTAMAELK